MSWGDIALRNDNIVNRFAYFVLFDKLITEKPMCGEDIHAAINRQNIAELERVLETKWVECNKLVNFNTASVAAAAQEMLSMDKKRVDTKYWSSVILYTWFCSRSTTVL